MTYPTIFANLAAGNEPLSLFDTMFNVVGQQGSIPCTATGTNAISLVSQTNYYVGASYTDGQLVAWQAANTSGGAVTMQWSGLGFVNYYNSSGVQANAGDIVSGTNYLSIFRSNLNSNAGGFITVNSAISNVANTVQGSYKNLFISVNGNSTVVPTADAIVLQNAGGGTARVTSFAPGNCTTATTGANALDAGSVATSTWYALYAIFNATTVTSASLLSTSFTSPALPSGYTYFARIGAVRTDGSSNLLRVNQRGPRAQYIVGSNPANALTVANGTAGTYSLTSPTLVAISFANFIPPTAREIHIAVNTNLNSAGLTSVELAPNTGWGGANNGPFGSNLNTYPILINGPTFGICMPTTLLVETSTTAGAAWASVGAAGGAVIIMGWTDQLP
jgi:hypothetical protein